MLCHADARMAGDAWRCCPDRRARRGSTLPLQSGDLSARGAAFSPASELDALKRSPRSQARPLERALRKLRGAGREPLVVDYNAVLGACARGPQGPLAAVTAVSLLREMRAEGLAPDALSYGSAIRAASGSPAVCERLFREMRGRGLAPDTHAYGAAIRALLARGQQAAALELLDELRQRGLGSSSSRDARAASTSCAAPLRATAREEPRGPPRGPTRAPPLRGATAARCCTAMRARTAATEAALGRLDSCVTYSAAITPRAARKRYSERDAGASLS